MASEECTRRKKRELWEKSFCGITFMCRVAHSPYGYIKVFEKLTICKDFERFRQSVGNKSTSLSRTNPNTIGFCKGFSCS